MLNCASASIIDRQRYLWLHVYRITKILNGVNHKVSNVLKYSTSSKLHSTIAFLCIRFQPSQVASDFWVKSDSILHVAILRCNLCCTEMLLLKKPHKRLQLHLCMLQKWSDNNLVQCCATLNRGSIYTTHFKMPNAQGSWHHSLKFLINSASNYWTIWRNSNCV